MPYGEKPVGGISKIQEFKKKDIPKRERKKKCMLIYTILRILKQPCEVRTSIFKFTKPLEDETQNSVAKLKLDASRYSMVP